MVTVAAFRQTIGRFLRDPEVRAAKKDGLIIMLGWSDSVIRRIVKDCEVNDAVDCVNITGVAMHTYGTGTRPPTTSQIRNSDIGVLGDSDDD